MRRPILDLATASTAIAQLDIDKVPTLTKSGIQELDRAADAFGRMTNAMRSFATYVPRTLVLNLLESGETASTKSQSRAVTVLFTDIVGFTTLSEAKSAADTAELLNHHFQLLNACIEAENGTVDKYIGDSVIFWGAPRSTGPCRPRNPGCQGNRSGDPSGQRSPESERGAADPAPRRPSQRRGSGRRHRLPRPYQLHRRRRDREYGKPPGTAWQGSRPGCGGGHSCQPVRG